MNNKKRKLILIVWVNFISIILLILLFLLGLRLPKLFKTKKQPNQQPQHQHQHQHIYDTNKIEDIVRLLIKLKQLQELKEQQKQKQFQEELIKSMDDKMSSLPLPQNDSISSKIPSLQELDAFNTSIKEGLDVSSDLIQEGIEVVGKLAKEGIEVVGKLAKESTPFAFALGAGILAVAVLGPAAAPLALI
uniref:p5 n=1 Tax=Chinaberry witches'-broom phytoplasma TaxID=389343 RepID=F5CUH6_9MOLU|nr:hypothetical protein [Chinaberry witches'-broom phytoplasma]AEC45510.1 p5 [Chinaberry witches'-broom phytoplasma]